MAEPIRDVSRQELVSLSRVLHRIPICGYIYDVKTGRLIEIPDAAVAGRAS